MTNSGRPSFESVHDLAARIEDGMSLAVGGTLFTRTPVQLLAAVCDAAPRNLHFVSWGGGFPLEMLLEAGAVRKATMCFSSLDIFGQAKRFQAAVADGDIELIEWTAHALHQALSAAKRHLPSEPFIWPAGSDLADLATFPGQVDDPISGTPVGAAAALRPDVLLLHAPAADEEGNIVLVGARATDLLAIPASRHVLVTVDAVVPRGDLRDFAAGAVVSRHFVTALALVPGGAAPTSSLPFYLADFQVLKEWAASSEPLAFARELGSGVNHQPETLPRIDAAAVRAALPATPADDTPASVDEWVVCRLAREYGDDSICSVGAVSPLAAASYLLAKETSAPSLTLITNGGCYVDVAPRPVLFGLGEWLDACSAITTMGGDESYEWFYQPGMVSHEVVSVAQIDAFGRTNNREVVTPTGRRLRLPGQGGMADVADMHRNFIIYLPRQSKLNTPERVEFASASRALLTAEERTAAGYQPGRVLLVTNLAVFEIDQSTRRFRLLEVFPWTTFDELDEATGFDLGVDALDGIPLVAAPSPTQLDALRRRVDPLGIRALEFSPSRDRGPLLEATIAAEADLARRLFEAPFYRRAATASGSG